jgi:hypothetical protein
MNSRRRYAASYLLRSLLVIVAALAVRAVL